MQFIWKFYKKNFYFNWRNLESSSFNLMTWINKIEDKTIVPDFDNYYTNYNNLYTSN